MAEFELKITGYLDELANLGVGLSLAGYGGAGQPVGDPVVETAEQNVVDAYAAVAAADTAKPNRTRKATTVDTPATGAETFAEQIKEVVAEETARPTEAGSGAATPAASTDASPSAPATTASPSDLKAECQALVKQLMGDSRYATADILAALEPFGGKGVTAIADSKPENIPGLHAKLTAMAAPAL